MHALIREELENHCQDVWFSCRKGREGHHELLEIVFISIGFPNRDPGVMALSFILDVFSIQMCMCV